MAEMTDPLAEVRAALAETDGPLITLADIMPDAQIERMLRSLADALEDARTRLATAEGELARLKGMACETCGHEWLTKPSTCGLTGHMLLPCATFGNGCRAWEKKA